MTDSPTKYKLAQAEACKRFRHAHSLTSGEDFYAEAAFNAGAAWQREQDANLVIEATRIPNDALRRGTGVRDALVIKGEQIAAQIKDPS